MTNKEVEITDGTTDEPEKKNRKWLTIGLWGGGTALIGCCLIMALIVYFGEEQAVEVVVTDFSDQVEQVDEVPEAVVAKLDDPTIEPTLAPTEEPAPTPTETPLPEPTAAPYLGNLIEKDGYSLAVVSVADPAEGGLFYDGEEGEHLVGVEFIVGNVSGDRVTINSLNGVLIDSEGFSHESEIFGIDDPIDLLDLEAGERVRGWTSFTVPDGVVPAKFRYEVSGFPRIVLESLLQAADGSIVSTVDVPISANPVPVLIESALGDLVEGGGYSLVAERIIDPAVGGVFYDPVPGFRLVSVEVVVGNVSGKLVGTNPLNGSLVDAGGFVYAAEVFGAEDDLDLIDLEPGDKARGTISFVVPEDAELALVRYQVTGFPLVELRSGLK